MIDHMGPHICPGCDYEALTATNKKLREALERIRRMKNARPDDIQGAAWRNGWNDAVCEVRTIAREALKEEEEGE